MTYGDIYDLFEPIFEWIQTNYPSGGFFIVDRNSAKFFSDKAIVNIYSKKLTDKAKKIIDILSDKSDKSEK